MKLSEIRFLLSLNLSARKAVKEKLRFEHPEIYHREQVNLVDLELLNQFNLQQIKSVPVYSTAKSEIRREYLDKDHIMDIHKKMKIQQKNPNEQYIQQIDLSPYAVFSFSKLQGEVLGQCFKEDKVFYFELKTLMRLV